MKSKPSLFWPYTLIIICALLPMVLSYFAAGFYTQHIVKNELAFFVQNEDSRIQRFLLKLNDNLEKLNISNGRCSAETILQLQQLTFDTPQIGFIALSTPEGQITCSQYGRTETQSPLKPHQDTEALHVLGMNYVKQLQRESFIIEKQTKNKSIIIVGLKTKHLKNNVDTIFGEKPFITVYSKSRDKLIATDESQKALVWTLHKLKTSEVSQSWLRYKTTEGSYLVYTQPITAFPDLLIVAGIKESFSHSSQLAVLLPFGLLGLFIAIILAYALNGFMKSRLSPLGELKRALENKEFIAHYQPIMSVETGKCVGAEALIRWKHPEEGMIYPNDFIPLAEESGLIIPMTNQLMESIATELKDFLKEYSLYISINFTAEHFKEDNVIPVLENHLFKKGLSPHQVTLELTERSFIDDAKHTTQKTLKKLRSLGCKIAIDDFGTGYSSLSYLKNFSLDYLKIDKAFMDAIGKDAVTSHIADSIIDMAQKLKLTIIAEGVETEEQIQYLKEKSVTHAQGYFFAKPLSLEDFKAFVRNRNKE